MNPTKENPIRGKDGAITDFSDSVEDTRPIIHTLGFLLYCFAGAKNALDRAVANPTVSGFLSCPEFRGLQICRYQPVGSNYRLGIRTICVPFISFGRGAVVRKAIGIARSMFLTPRPPYARKKAFGGFNSHRGDMNHV